MTRSSMIRKCTFIIALTASLSAHAALQLVLDGQTLTLATAVLDTVNGTLTVDTGQNMSCSNFTPVPADSVPLAVVIDGNGQAEIDNDLVGAFTIARIEADTVINVKTKSGNMSCSSLPEMFLKDGFED